MEELAEEHPVCHVFYYGFLGCAVFETDVVADLVAKFNSLFLRNPGSNTHRRNPPRLSTPDQPLPRIPNLMQILRDLRRLPRSRLPHEYQQLIIPDSLQELLSKRVYRQLLPLQLDLCLNWRTGINLLLVYPL